MFITMNAEVSSHCSISLRKVFVDALHHSENELFDESSFLITAIRLLVGSRRMRANTGYRREPEPAPEPA